MAAADHEELLKSQSRYQELKNDFTALQSEHATLQKQLSQQETQQSASSGEQARLERQLKELQRGRTKLLEASEASEQQVKDLQQLLRSERSKTGALTLQLATAHKATEDRIKEADSLKKSLAAKTAEAASSAQALEALADDLKRSKENHERSQQQLNEEKNKVHELLQQVDGLEEKCSEEQLRATTLDQQLSLLKQEADLAAARLAQQETAETHLSALKAQLTAEQAKFQEAQTRNEAELKRYQVALDTQAHLMQAMHQLLSAETEALEDELEDGQLLNKIEVLVGDRKAFLQEVATLKKCKETLEATILHERQRSADAVAALQAFEQRMSVEQQNSHQMEQERVEELEILQQVSMSKASEIQHLEKQLASTQQQLQLEVDAKERLQESKEAEILQLLKERDEQRHREREIDLKTSQLQESLTDSENRLAKAMEEKSRVEEAMRKAEEEARNSLQSQRATEESSAVEIKELHKSLEKAKREVSQLKDSVMTAKEECQSLQVQVNAQKAHEVKLEMQLQTLQEDLKAERDRARKLLQSEAKSKQHQEESERCAAKMAELQKDLGDTKEELTTCQMEASKLKDRLEQATTLEAEHQNDAQRWAKRVMELEQSSGKVFTQLKKAEAKVEMLESQLQEAHAEIGQLRIQLAMIK